eukprot:scpid59649/ scgid0554/ Retrovirus-related Pol polyprotein from transposon 17.6; Protease; Reverse transcriptase; Endonuclease
MSSSDPSSVQPASRGSSPAGGGGSNGGSGSSSGGAPSTSSSAPEPAQVSLPGMVHLSQVSPPSSFNFQAADQWDRWLRRFNRYRQASGLHTQPESVQVNSLLYTMGEQADDLLDSFHLPEDDVSKFTTVTERFTAHFGKKRNYVYERACFHQRTQQPTESLDAFVNDLYRLADRCNFKAMHDEMLRDRLIAGLADARLSERLQMDSDMTLEKALAHARQSAAIKEQQTTVCAAPDSSSDITAEFPDLFSGLGTFGPLHTIQLRDEAPPYSLSTPRRVALPMESKVIEALRRMEDAGVIRPVSEPTDWCAGMVVVPKPNGSVRICGDFTRLNKAVKRERHILPTTDHLLARLGDAKVFSKLDANSGFHQIPLAPESQLLTTFITPIGRFCYTRLPFGISSAPEYFQKQMSDLLSDLPGNICMMDDVLTFGSTLEEEVDNLRPALARLQSAGVTLNSEKCQFHATSIKFLGHVIDGCGIRPDPDKIHAIQELSPCSDVHSVRRLLGMANHLGKFIPDLASITQPLRSLLVKGTPWQWGAEQCAAFDRIKTSLSNEPVLAKYSPNYHTTVSADASSFGLGAVLLQRQPDASVRPVAYLSRSLTPAETRYSQIEKEALAATWACDRLSHYLLGMPFTIETDHKPLIPLLGTRALDDLPPRVLRFRLRLLRFDYSIIHTPGKQLAIADALSRAPLRSTDADATATLEAETAAMVSYVTEALPATAQRLDEVSAWQSDPQ